HLNRWRRRRGFCAPHHSPQRRDLVVQADRVVEGILTRAVLHLIDLLLDGGEPPFDRVGLLRNPATGISRKTAGARGSAIELLAYLADSPHRVVRGAHAARDAQEQVELALIFLLRRLHAWVGPHRELARL